MYLPQINDWDNGLRYMEFHEISCRKEDVVEAIIRSLNSIYNDEPCCLEIVDGVIHHKLSGSYWNGFTEFTTLIDQRKPAPEGDPYPTTIDELRRYLLTHDLHVGWADRGCCTYNILEVSVAKAKEYMAEMIAGGENEVPWTKDEIAASEAEHGMTKDSTDDDWLKYDLGGGKQLIMS